jgi:hypothetical protein
VGWRRRKRTNTVRGSGLSARVDSFEPTRSDTAPSGPQENCPATSRLQRSASPGMCSIEANCLPRQNDAPDPRITLHFDEVVFLHNPERFWAAMRFAQSQ